MKSWIVFLIVAAALWPRTLSAQAPNGWSILNDVIWGKAYNERYKNYYVVPEFGEKPRRYEGKEITVTGYIVPMAPVQPFYVLSKNPYSSCFFCGQAGPETVIELILEGDRGKKQRRYKLDEHLTFRGRLRLNAEDNRYLHYILEDARLVKQ